MRGKRGKRVFGLTVVGGLATAATALAATVPISGTTLQSDGGTALWNPVNSTNACLSGPGYSPVEDGSMLAPRPASDAFDDGLVVLLGKKSGVLSFNDPDGNGNLKGQTLNVGPAKVAGLDVSRSDAGLPGSPTLRDLVKLQNPSSKAFSGVLVLDSNLGSDTSTLVTGTSSGDKKITTMDRWTVTTDDKTAPSDPPVTLVYYGSGTVRSKASALIQTPGHGSDCATTEFHVAVPGHSTRYMLFFAEMHADNPSALAAAKKFNKKHLAGALLKGVSSRVQKNILNWDLG
jgi:hypothetical protein